MCLRPLAYGQATATRIFLGLSVVLTGANDREPPPGHTARADTRTAERQCEQQHDVVWQARSVPRCRRSTVDVATRRIGRSRRTFREAREAGVSHHSAEPDVGTADAAPSGGTRMALTIPRCAGSGADTAHRVVRRPRQATRGGRADGPRPERRLGVRRRRVTRPRPRLRSAGGDHHEPRCRLRLCSLHIVGGHGRGDRRSRWLGRHRRSCGRGWKGRRRRLFRRGRRRGRGRRTGCGRRRG